MMLESPVQPVTNPTGQVLNVNATVTLDTAVTTPGVTNHPVTNTETPLVLPANTKRFLVRPRAAKVLLAYQAGGPQITIHPASVYEEKDINRASTTLYLTSGVLADTVDVIHWQ